MSNQEIKKNNHLLPRLIIKNWETQNGQLYNKNTNSIRKIKQLDYSKKYYYSLGIEDDFLENRIAKFEDVISPILRKVDDAENSINISGKDLELLKLFCVLAACRQDNTASFIKNDESGIYQHNNYIFGIPLIKTQTEAVNTTSQIIDEVERLNNLSNDDTFINWARIMRPNNNGLFAIGQHLSILRNAQVSNIVSDICAIIECTMDSDYLFTYVPISPKTALLLVKSKYFNDFDEYTYTLQRFGKKYGSGKPDPFLSAIFEKSEGILFNSYSSVKSSVHVKETYIKINDFKSATIKINEIPLDAVRQFNSVFYEDGNKIIFTNQKEFDFAKTHQLNSRTITVGL